MTHVPALLALVVVGVQRPAPVVEQVVATRPAGDGLVVPRVDDRVTFAKDGGVEALALEPGVEGFGSVTEFLKHLDQRVVVSGGVVSDVLETGCDPLEILLGDSHERFPFLSVQNLIQHTGII